MLGFTLAIVYPILQFAYIFPQRLRPVKVPTVLGLQIHSCVVVYRIQARFNNWVPGFPCRVIPRPFFGGIHLSPMQGTGVSWVLLSVVAEVVVASAAQV